MCNCRDHTCGITMIRLSIEIFFYCDYHYLISKAKLKCILTPVTKLYCVDVKKKKTCDVNFDKL